MENFNYEEFNPLWVVQYPVDPYLNKIFGVCRKRERGSERFSGQQLKFSSSLYLHFRNKRSNLNKFKRLDHFFCSGFIFYKMRCFQMRFICFFVTINF